MSPEEIERLKYRLDVLEEKQNEGVPEIEEEEIEEAPPVELLDHEDDDPRGELGASIAANISETSKLRERLELAEGTIQKLALVAKKQGYKV